MRIYYRGTRNRPYTLILATGHFIPPLYVTPNLKTAKFFAGLYSGEYSDSPVVLKLNLQGFKVEEDPYFRLGLEKEFEGSPEEILREVRKMKGKLFVVNELVPASRILEEVKW